MGGIEKLLFELLHDHDCVVLPGFGGFVGNYTPAKVDHVRHKLTPPRKQISFNRKLQHNDGLLTHHAARSWQLTYEQALKKVEAATEQIERSLHRESRITLSNIGTLYLEKQDNIRFEPNLSHHFLPASYGLKAFYATPRRVATNDQRQKPMMGAATPASTKGKRRNIRRRAFALGAIIAPLLIYLSWFASQPSLLSEKQQFHYSDLNPFSDKKCPAFIPRSTLSNLVEQDFFEKEAAIGNTLQLVENEELLPLAISLSEKKLAVQDHTLVVAPLRKDVFHIVVGSFQFKKNARQLVRKLEKMGYRAAIIGRHNGSYRVSAGQFVSRSSANPTLRAVKGKLQPQAWILAAKE